MITRGIASVNLKSLTPSENPGENTDVTAAKMASIEMKEPNYS